MEILHQRNEQRFIIQFDQGDPAILKYSLRDDVLDLYHVYVPMSRRGQGLAEKITRYAFDYAREQNLRIKATCPYIANHFISKHGDEYVDVLI